MAEFLIDCVFNIALVYVGILYGSWHTRRKLQGQQKGLEG